MTLNSSCSNLTLWPPRLPRAQAFAFQQSLPSKRNGSQGGKDSSILPTLAGHLRSQYHDPPQVSKAEAIKIQEMGEEEGHNIHPPIAASHSCQTDRKARSLEKVGDALIP